MVALLEVETTGRKAIGVQDCDEAARVRCWPCADAHWRTGAAAAVGDGEAGEVNAYDVDHLEPGEALACFDCGAVLYVEQGGDAGEQLREAERLLALAQAARTAAGAEGDDDEHPAHVRWWDALQVRDEVLREVVGITPDDVDEKTEGSCFDRWQRLMRVAGVVSARCDHCGVGALVPREVAHGAGGDLCEACAKVERYATADVERRRAKVVGMLEQLHGELVRHGVVAVLLPGELRIDVALVDANGLHGALELAGDMRVGTDYPPNDGVSLLMYDEAGVSRTRGYALPEFRSVAQTVARAAWRMVRDEVRAEMVDEPGVTTVRGVLAQLDRHALDADNPEAAEAFGVAAELVRVLASGES